MQVGSHQNHATNLRFSKAHGGLTEFVFVLFLNSYIDFN